MSTEDWLTWLTEELRLAIPYLISISTEESGRVADKRLRSADGETQGTPGDILSSGTPEADFGARSLFSRLCIGKE